MKLVIPFAMFLALSLPSLSHAAPVFNGSVKYHAGSCPSGQDCGSRPSFSDLEQLGVRKAAEDDAVSNCFAAGYSICYASSSRITTCNVSDFEGGILYVACSGSATAVGLTSQQ